MLELMGLKKGYWDDGCTKKKRKKERKSSILFVKHLVASIIDVAFK